MLIFNPCVFFIAKEYGISPASILILHDDMERRIGATSLKLGGSHGGHNGIRSIQASLRTADFARLRIGIGRPPGEAKRGRGEGDTSVTNFVLGRFDDEEKEVLHTVGMRSVEETLLKWLLLSQKQT